MDDERSQKRTAHAHGSEKSDFPIVPRKRPNKPLGAEAVEGRGKREENMRSRRHTPDTVLDPKPHADDTPSLS
jgi:hypothetical protein